MKRAYLDIDGVILANDGQAALHADEFIEHLLGRYDVFWLTTHCRNPGDDPIPMLSRFFADPTLALLKKIQPAYWDVLKTEAIDFSKPFVWIDDDCFDSEREVLMQHDALESWIEVDLAKDPRQLSSLIGDL